MLEKRYIGTEFEPFTIEVEKQPLRLFAKAIGETNPIYTVESAAIAAGYRSLLAPPTYLYTLIGLGPNPWAGAKLVGIPSERNLHAEQSFEYFAPVVAGDRLTFTESIVDVFEKKDGELEFVVTETTVTNQTGALVARLRETDVINHRQGS